MTLFKLFALTFTYSVFIVLIVGHDERLIDGSGHHHGRGCGTMQYNEDLLAQDKEWRDRLNAFEEKWSDRQLSVLEGGNITAQQSITIPVVFHIVSLDPFSIPDSAIAFQLRVLEDDFSANNEDYNSGVPEEFHPVRSGDTGIRFYTQEGQVWFPLLLSLLHSSLCY